MVDGSAGRIREQLAAIMQHEESQIPRPQVDYDVLRARLGVVAASFAYLSPEQTPDTSTTE